MKLHTNETAELHQEIAQAYKDRLNHLENEDEAGEDEEKEEPFERSFLHNAIYLHALWFEQLSGSKEQTESPLLEEILERRESNLDTFMRWMNGFARDARPHGWAIWGWSNPLNTFVGFPIKSHDDKVPLGVQPILVIDVWEHSYIADFGTDLDGYLDKFWKEINWDVIEQRHHDLASQLGYDIK